MNQQLALQAVQAVQALQAMLGPFCRPSPPHGMAGMVSPW